MAQPRRRRRSGQAEMVAQYLAVVVAAQEGRGGGVPARLGRQQYVVTVGGAVDEPLFKGVGDPSWGAADHPVAARRGGKVVEVPQGHVLTARHVVEHAVEGAAALGRRRGRVLGHRAVAADIVTDPAVFVWRNRP
jgi:hypothetical protein